MTAVPVTPREASFYEALRPFALVAVVAFVLGFLGYVALSRPAPSPSESAAAAVVAPEPAAAGPASDDWNLPKHI